MDNKKKHFRMPSAFTILYALLAIIALLTWAFNGQEAGNATVTGASLSQFIMAPWFGIVGLPDGVGPSAALDVILFVLFIGGLLGVVTETGALEAGVAKFVQGSKGRETLMIIGLMFLFSIGGTTFGMAEETLAFYAIVTVAMLAAGYDGLVALAIVLLGAGVGVLGSTVNPFSTSIAVDSAGFGPEVMPLIYLVGVILWLTSFVAASWFVVRYAKKVKAKKENSAMSEEETKACEKEWHSNVSITDIVWTWKEKMVLVLFGIVFIIMILGLIPWESLAPGLGAWFDRSGNIAEFVFGAPLGTWGFSQLSMWFLVVSIIIGIVASIGEARYVKAFVSGAADMVGVALIIGLARGISMLMFETGLDAYFLAQLEIMLQSVAGGAYIAMSNIVYIIMSFLIPSTSGLATVSMPIFGPLSVSVLGEAQAPLIVNSFNSASGIVNLVTPTSGVVMGALAITRVGYGTYLKWVSPLLGILFVIMMITLVIIGPLLAMVV